MAYALLYGDRILYDPYTDSTVTSAKLTAKSNNPDYLDFDMPRTHALYDEVRERGDLVTLEWDGVTLFTGEVETIECDFEGTKSISCVGGLSWLNDTVVRPYSTIGSEGGLTAPSTVDGLFEWYVRQHNQHAADSRRTFQIGTNQGAALDANNHVYRASSQLPTTWDEIDDKILGTLGGYVTVDYSPLTVSLWADVHEQNEQVIDLGVNLTDLTFQTATDGLYTAVRPRGDRIEQEGGDTEASEEYVDITGLDDGQVKGKPYVKRGDVVYSPDAVERYGYREVAWTNSDCSTAAGLLESACKHLASVCEPSVTVTVKAVDLALVSSKYSHLKVGHAVRVRSAYHGLDEYLVVESCDVDLQNPGNTEYTLGTGVNTATGLQSAYLAKLSGNVNSALDATDAISDTAKAAAKDASDAKETAGGALDEAKAATEAVKDTVESVRVEYSTSADPAAEPTSGWSEDKPGHEAGEYTWMRTVTVKKDGTETVSAAAVITGDKGDQGEKGDAGPQGETGKAGASVKSVKVLYYLSDSSATPAGGAWQDSVPAWVAGKYIWQKAVTTVIDAGGAETTTEGDPVLYGAFNSLAEDVSGNMSRISQTAAALGVTFAKSGTTSTLIKATSDGLEVGKTTDGTNFAGVHTKAGASSFAIHDKSHGEMATFGANLVELAKASTAGSIEFFKGAMRVLAEVVSGGTRDTQRMRVGTDNDYSVVYLDSGRTDWYHGYVDVSSDLGTQLECLGGYVDYMAGVTGAVDSGLSSATVTLRGDNVSFASSTGKTSFSVARGNLQRRLQYGNNCFHFVGSKVVNLKKIDDTHADCVLFTNAEFKAVTGHNFSVASDCVEVMNGDTVAQNSIYAMLPCWNASEGQLHVKCVTSQASSGSTRLNYHITCK